MKATHLRELRVLRGAIGLSFSRHKRRRPAALSERRGVLEKNSGSDLLSHTQSVQYHRLWRA